MYSMTDEKSYLFRLNGEKKRKHRRRKLKDKNSIYGDIWFDMDEETR